MGILSSSLTEILARVFVLFTAISIHEYAHGLIAYKLGDPTAKYAGRLTLNPLSHLDPIGAVCMAIFGFGWAKPVPVNPMYFKDRKKDNALVALAGPVSNILLAFFSTILTALYSAFVLFKFNNFITQFFFTVLVQLAVVNISFAVFNLLPIYPLDGYKIVEGFTRANNPFTRFMRVYGQYILIALIAVSVLVDSFGFPYWLDVLGLYIDTARGAIITVLEKFWNLFF